MVSAFVPFKHPSRLQLSHRCIQRSISIAINQLERINGHPTLIWAQSRYPNNDNIVQPIVALVASLQHDMSEDLSIRLGWTCSVDVDIRAVIRLQLVASIGLEDILIIEDAPFCAEG